MADPQTSEAQAPPPRPPQRVQLTWKGEHRFEGGRADAPSITMDASGKAGPSPVDVLLLALAGCTCVDVTDILAKRRTPAATLDVEVVAQRANAVPARVIAVTITYNITGEGVERVHAERAIELAITKYCSVRDSLDPNLPIDWKLILNGA